MPHTSQTPRDQPQIPRRRRNPPLQQPGPTCRHRAVHGRQQGPLPSARQGLRQFQIAPRCRVDLHCPPRHLALRRAQQWKFSALGQFEIVHQRAQSRDFRPAKRPERLHRADTIQRLQPGLAANTVKARPGHWRDSRAHFCGKPPKFQLAPLCHQQLAWRDAREFGLQPGQRQRHHPQFAGRNIRPGQRRLGPDLGKSGEVVVPPRL